MVKMVKLVFPRALQGCGWTNIRRGCWWGCNCFHWVSSLSSGGVTGALGVYLRGGPYWLWGCWGV